MRTARLLTVSRSIPCISGSATLPWMQTLLDVDPFQMQTPLDADPPWGRSPMAHPSPREQNYTHK